MPKFSALLLPLAAVATSGFVGPAASANLTIVPTFTSSITGDANKASIEAGINAAISRIEAAIATPITVNIDFYEATSGLGENSSTTANLSYSKFRTDLLTKQILSANDNKAIASLQAQTNNPVDGNANVSLTLPNLRALGETTLGSNGGGYDGDVGLYIPLLNLSRTGTQDPNKYDLQAVATHEIDEVLGIGGWGSVIGDSGWKTGPVGSEDLFRYKAANSRSYSSSSSATAYFSIDGGMTNLSGFNQDSSGDYADWASGPTPQVQDAFGSPGIDTNLGINELTAFDVVGYNLVPEPGSVALLSVVGAGLLGGGRRRWKRNA